MPRLRVLPTNDRPFDVALLHEVVIGRSPPADIVIHEALVSRRHCRVHRTPGGWALEDLGSANGTTLNGVSTTHAPLANGDRIGVEFAAAEFVDD